MGGFEGVRKGNYFREEQLIRSEVGATFKKLKYGKAASKDEVRGDIVKIGTD